MRAHRVVLLHTQNLLGVSFAPADRDRVLASVARDGWFVWKEERTADGAVAAIVFKKRGDRKHWNARRRVFMRNLLAPVRPAS